MRSYYFIELVAQALVKGLWEMSYPTPDGKSEKWREIAERAKQLDKDITTLIDSPAQPASEEEHG